MKPRVFTACVLVVSLALVLTQAVGAQRTEPLLAEDRGGPLMPPSGPPAGQRVSSTSPPSASGDNAYFSYPVGVSMGSGEAVSVADPWNRRVQKSAAGVLGWQQVNIDGFGNPRNRYISALEVFDGHLYAGTWNWNEGGRVWRYTSGRTWTAVTEYNFGSGFTGAVLDLIEFRGLLYAAAGWHGVGKIWRSSNGVDWTGVVTDGFGDADTFAIASFAVYGNTLYAATHNVNDGLEIWRSSTGNSGEWSRVVTGGNGDVDNRIAVGMTEFDGYLYAAVENWADGCEVWRTGDGVSWTAVAKNSYNNGEKEGIQGLVAFDGHLYSGSAEEFTTATPGQLWRSSNGTTWTQVTGNGFGDSNNVSMTPLASHGGYLYVATTNTHTGMEVWRTPDGTAWEQVNEDGFGDSNNGGTMWSTNTAIFNDNLYIGGSNETTGGEVWMTSAAAKPISVDRLEITQATQNASDSIPLVANKHTVVRVHIDDGDDNTLVTGVLTVRQGGNQIPGSPFSPDNGPITARVNPQPYRHENHTLNFLLSGVHFDPATYEFEVALKASGVTVDTDFETRSFSERGNVRILYYPIIVGGMVPAWSTMASSGIFMRQTYPVPWDGIELVAGDSYVDCQCPFVDANVRLDLYSELNNRLFWYNLSHPTQRADFVAGFVPAGLMDGAGKTRMEKEVFIRDHEVHFSVQATLAHEIGHLLGLGDEYTGGTYQCGVNPPAEVTGAPCNEFDPGTGNGTDASWQAFDVEAPRVASLAYSEITGVYRNEDNRRRFSFMGATNPSSSDITERRHNNWVTDKAYSHLYNHVGLQAASALLPRLDAGEFLLLSGQIHQDDTVKLAPWYRVTGTTTPTSLEGSGYSLELRDSTNTVLATYSFGISFQELSNPPQILDAAPFSFVIPFPANTATILIKHDTTTIKAVTVSDNAPSVTVTSPNGGESWGGEETITWTATDPDVDSLAYAIEYTPNDSDWYPIATNITTTHFTWDTNYSPGGTAARVRVIASDGVNTGQDESDATFTTTTKPPLASVVSPVSGAEVVSGSLVSFSGVGIDLEDGQLGEDALVWSSSLSGTLGIGELLSMRNLPEGTHAIILTVTDSDLMVGSDAITITVLTDTDGDGMPDTWENAHTGLKPGVYDAASNLDNDGLINIDEYYFGTIPSDPDTDDDGYKDGLEIAMGSDPLDPESIPAWTGYLPAVSRQNWAQADYDIRKDQ